MSPRSVQEGTGMTGTTVTNPSISREAAARLGLSGGNADQDRRAAEKALSSLGFDLPD